MLHIHYVSGVDALYELGRLHQRLQDLETQLETLRRNVGILMEHLAAAEPQYIRVFGLDQPRQQ